MNNNPKELRVWTFVVCTAAMVALPAGWVAQGGGNPALAQAPGPAAADRLLVFRREAECPAPADTKESGDPATTSAVPREFVAAVHFKEDTSTAAAVQIAWLGSAFQQHFVSKTEPAVEGTVRLRVHELRVPARDQAIIAELGDTHETMLGHLWCLLRQQGKGEDGALATDGVPNVFYVRDGDGTLRVIDALWGGAGWEIGASTTDNPYAWSAGRRVISR